MEQQLNIFRKRKMTFTLVFASIIAMFVISSLITQYNPAAGIESVPKAFSWITHKLVPGAQSLEHLPVILKDLYQTALLSVAVTVTSGIFALFFALLGSKTTRINSAIGRTVRIIASFFRNVSDVAWALILMFFFGQNVLTGFLALFFYTFGLLTRTFIETIDEVSESCVEALTATGIGYRFDFYFKKLDYASASLVVISVIVLVIAIEMISNKIRKVILL